MDNLKMKFKLHGLEFELEGNEATVKKEFENFKTFTIELLSKVNIITPQVTALTQDQQFKQIGAPIEPESIVLTETPSLKEVKLRDLAKSETDWLLVYAYNASGGGTKEFTRENLLKLYRDSERYTEYRGKTLSAYIKSISKAQYIKATNDTHFILLEKGKLKATEIFQGKSNSTSRSDVKSLTKVKAAKNAKAVEKDPLGNKSIKPKTNKTNSVGFVDLKLTSAEQKSLNEFFENKNPKTQNEKVIVAMKWFIDAKKIDEVSMEEMNYLLSIAAETPSALAQVLGNMIGAGFRWVTKGEVGKYKLSSIGENHVVNKLPKAIK